MMPLLIAAGAIALLVLLDSGKLPANPFHPNRIVPTAPGPGAQVNAQTPPSSGGIKGPQPGVGTGNVGSPNSVLSTINGTVVVANNALGMYDHLEEYFGGNKDSEYPVGPISPNVEGFETPLTDASDSSYTDSAEQGI